MAFQFEFDAVNKILLMRFEGKLTQESVAEFYGLIRKNAIATDASSTIADFTSTTEYALSGDFLRQLADLKPAMPDAMRPRFIVAPTQMGFTMMRIFEIAGQGTRPRLRVVHTMGEALAALGVPSPHFEPLQ